VDLDGTLFNDQREPTQANIDALVRAKAKGYEIVFTTGRAYPFIDSLNTICGNISRYAIAGSGSTIFDMHEKKIIHCTPMPKAAVEKICELDCPGLVWFFHCPGGSFSNLENFPYQNNTTTHFTEPVSEFIKTRPIHQVWFGSRNFDLIKSFAPKIEKIPGIYISNQHKSQTDPSFPQRGTAFYDITSMGVSKGNGVKIVCDLLGIPKENRIAIGDDINDISMFAEVGYSVAMGNAIPDLKKVATYITDDNNNDGVAKFLNSLIKKE